MWLAIKDLNICPKVILIAFLALALFPNLLPNVGMPSSAQYLGPPRLAHASSQVT